MINSTAVGLFSIINGVQVNLGPKVACLRKRFDSVKRGKPLPEILQLVESGGNWQSPTVAIGWGLGLLRRSAWA
jgi:hypothetical protein